MFKANSPKDLKKILQSILGYFLTLHIQQAGTHTFKEGFSIEFSHVLENSSYWFAACEKILKIAICFIVLGVSGSNLSLLCIHCWKSVTNLSKYVRVYFTLKMWLMKHYRWYLSFCLGIYEWVNCYSPSLLTQ